MANVVTIEAEVRARSGKGAARATRRAGKVPGVIYGGKQEPSLIALDPRDGDPRTAPRRLAVPAVRDQRRRQNRSAR